MKKIALVLLLLSVSNAQAERIFRDGFGDDEGAGIDPCAHLIQPEGWQRIDKTWARAFGAADGNPLGIFPHSPGFPVPFPGKLDNGSQASSYVQKGQYMVVAFTPEPNQTGAMTWDTAQANTPQGYPNPRPAYGMFIGISDTPGDFCTLLPAFDPCARISGLDSMYWSTHPDASSSVCPLVAGQTYYINVVMADPTDGFQFGEHTCQDTTNTMNLNGCDVQIRHSGN